MGGEAPARSLKLRVERRPFLASKTVIFGVDFTGPHILIVSLFGKYASRGTLPAGFSAGLPTRTMQR